MFDYMAELESLECLFTDCVHIFCLLVVKIYIYNYLVDQTAQNCMRDLL